MSDEATHFYSVRDQEREVFKMAFLGDLGKAIAGAGQTAVNKTKDLTEITRLSAKVSDLQRKND